MVSVPKLFYFMWVNAEWRLYKYYLLLHYIGEFSILFADGKVLLYQKKKIMRVMCKEVGACLWVKLRKGRFVVQGIWLNCEMIKLSSYMEFSGLRGLIVNGNLWTSQRQVVLIWVKYIMCACSLSEIPLAILNLELVICTNGVHIFFLYFFTSWLFLLGPCWFYSPILFWTPILGSPAKVQT